VQIVIETAALRAHQLVELAFAGMAERRMANIVDESERFRKFGVQPQREATVRAICATSSVCVGDCGNGRNSGVVKLASLASRRRKARNE